MRPTVVFPYLFVYGAEDAIAWYSANLGAVEKLRVSSPDGSAVVHSRLQLGDTMVMLSDAARDCSEVPTPDGPSSAKLMLYVADVDATQAVCLANGATELMPVEDRFWGERVGEIRDPFGHVWYLATVIEDLWADEIAARAKDAFGR